MTTARHELHCTAPVAGRALRAFEQVEGRPVNFDASRLGELVASGEWNVDRRRRELPAEAPGDPVVGGPFVVARRILERYEFADPRLVRAVFRADAPLEGRDMLLVGRFYGLRFHMGVRVGGVVDDDAVVDGRPVRRFAWHYRTLEGHLERGQMDYELVKWRDTGQVEARIWAASQRGHIDNPVVRLGFGMFGRRTQLTFYARALDRLSHLVDERGRR